jgi:enoyl-CoA hydratase
VPGDQLVEVVDGLALRIVGRGPRAVRAALVALRQGSDAGLGAGLALESALAGLVTGSEEAGEGIAAFRERRRPSFDRSPENRSAP